MTRAKRTRIIIAWIAPACLLLACSPGLFGRRTLEQDLAKTAMEIERIYQLNLDTQKVVENQMRMLETRQQTQSELVLRTLTEIEQRVAALQETLDAVRSQMEEIRYRSASESADRLAIRVGQGDQASTVVLQGEQLLLDGQKALQRRDFVAARVSFQEFLKQFAGSPRAADAQMWVAESFYREGKWNEAKAAFAVVEQRYVASPRVPDALFKTALCDRQLGQRDQAVATLERLIAKYPKWDQIPQAQEILSSLTKAELQVPPAP